MPLIDPDREARLVFEVAGLRIAGPLVGPKQEQECICLTCGTRRLVRLSNLRKGGIACRWCHGWAKWGEWGELARARAGSYRSIRGELWVREGYAAAPVSPAWSSEGELVFVERSDFEGRERLAFWDGVTVQPISDSETDGDLSNLALSPDGEELFYLWGKKFLMFARPGKIAGPQLIGGEDNPTMGLRVLGWVDDTLLYAELCDYPLALAADEADELYETSGITADTKPVRCRRPSAIFSIPVARLRPKSAPPENCFDACVFTKRGCSEREIEKENECYENQRPDFSRLRKFARRLLVLPQGVKSVHYSPSSDYLMYSVERGESADATTYLRRLSGGGGVQRFTPGRGDSIQP